MEHGDVPTRRHAGQKLHQRAGALWEFEAVNQFAGGEFALAADHVAHMLGRKIVVRQVDGRIAMAPKVSRECLVVAGAGCANANKDMRQ